MCCVAPICDIARMYKHYHWQWCSKHGDWLGSNEIGWFYVSLLSRLHNCSSSLISMEVEESGVSCTLIVVNVHGSLEVPGSHSPLVSSASPWSLLITLTCCEVEHLHYSAIFTETRLRERFRHMCWNADFAYLFYSQNGHSVATGCDVTTLVAYFCLHQVVYSDSLCVQCICA